MAPGAPRDNGPASDATGVEGAGPVVSGMNDHVKLRAEATVNGERYAVFIEAPRAMWDNSLTDLRPDLGRTQVEGVLREKLALEIAKRLDVTVTEEHLPYDGEGTPTDG